MRSSNRRRLSALVGAAALALALTGCQASAGPAPEPASSAPVVSPAGRDVSEGLSAGTGAVAIELWTDLSCPYCAQLESEVGELITAWVSSGDVTLTIHPLNFVSGMHGDETAWSTRGANALAAAVDAGEAETLPVLYGTLQAHQSAADGSHPTDAEILTLATEAGVSADLSDAVAADRFGPWVQASNDYWLGRTIAGTDQVVKGVPILVVDGTVFEVRFDDTDASRLTAAVEAAQAG